MADRDVEMLLRDIRGELTAVREIYPEKHPTLAALVMEVGKLSLAASVEPRAEVRRRVIHVAVCAMRVILDGDHTLDDWRWQQGLSGIKDPEGPVQ